MFPFRIVALWLSELSLGPAKYSDLPGILSAGGTWWPLKNGDPAVAIP